MTELIKNMKELNEQSKTPYFISKYNFLLKNEVYSTGFEHNDRIMIKNGYLVPHYSDNCPYQYSSKGYDIYLSACNIQFPKDFEILLLNNRIDFRSKIKLVKDSVWTDALLTNIVNRAIIGELFDKKYKNYFSNDTIISDDFIETMKTFDGINDYADKTPDDEMYFMFDHTKEEIELKLDKIVEDYLVEKGENHTILNVFNNAMKNIEEAFKNPVSTVETIDVTPIEIKAEPATMTDPPTVERLDFTGISKLVNIKSFNICKDIKRRTNMLKRLICLYDSLKNIDKGDEAYKAFFNGYFSLSFFDETGFVLKNKIKGTNHLLKFYPNQQWNSYSSIAELKIDTAKKMKKAVPNTGINAISIDKLILGNNNNGLIA